MRALCCGYLSTLLVLCSLPFASAQTSAQAPIPTIEAKARAVIVDVVVTAGNDGPVSGLRKEDFKVIEDGSAQSVTFFEEHKGIPAAPIQLAPMPPNVFTNVPDAPPADAVNVLLLDELNTPSPDQSYVRDQVISFLKAMPKGTPLAIFTLTTRLRMVQGFTNDPSALLASMLDKKNGVWPETQLLARSIQDDADDRSQLATMSTMRDSPFAIAASASAQQTVKGYEAGERIEMTAVALQNLARYLARIPGRKNLIWFASRFPVAFFPNTKVDGTMQAGPRIDGLKETADLLTVSRVAIYPVGARGLETVVSGDAQEWSKTSAREGASGEAGDIYANGLAMHELAADTGGEVFKNTNDLGGALSRAIQNGSHYYTLSYSPTNKTLDGNFRHIEIRVPQGKYTVSYRRGYYAFDSATPHANAPTSAKSTGKPQVATQNPLQRLMQRGVPSSTQILYGLHVLPATAPLAKDAPRAGANVKLTGPVTRYGVDFLIQAKDVNFELMPDGTHRGRVQVEMMAYDRDGNALNWVGATMGMSIQPEVFAGIQKSGLPAHLDIDVPKGDTYLATGVYDWNTAKAGTLEVPLSAVTAAAVPVSVTK